MKNVVWAVVTCCVTMGMVGCTKKEEQPYRIESGTVVDADGHVYVTVKIGEQWWMAENLRVSQFNDGTTLNFIPRVDGVDSVWAQAEGAAYCFINDSLFGFLYNAQVLQSQKNIAPAGWHVPTDEEWRELEITLGMTSSEAEQTGWRGENEANLLTAQYNAGWPANDQDVGLYGSDFYGFNAKPSSIRSHDGRTNIQSNSAWWWCNTTESGDFYYRTIDTYHQRIFRQSMLPANGLSIRCVKD